MQLLSSLKTLVQRHLNPVLILPPSPKMDDAATALATDEKGLLSPSFLSSSLNSGTCRLCYQTAPVTSLLRPCRCTSPSPFVHRSCLDDWRAFNLDGHSFSHCSQCHSAYRFVPVQDSDEAALERSLQWQSHTSQFLTWLAVVGLSALLFLAIFINACDLSNHIPPSFPSLSPLMAYFIVALLLLLFLANVWGVVAFSYGLHLPMTHRSNYHSTPADYAFVQRPHHCFCFHPDLFCYSCYGLYYEYAMISWRGASRWVDGALVVLMVAATWLVGLFFGCVVGVWVLYRTGGRYIERLRLQQLTRKFVVRDLWEATNDDAEKAKLEGDAGEETIPTLAPARLSDFVDGAPQGTGAVGGQGEEAAASGSRGLMQSRGSSMSGEGDGSIEQWQWRVVVEDEKGEREEVEEQEVEEEEDAESGDLNEWLGERDEEVHTSLSDWLGGDAAVENGDIGEVEARHERAIV